MFRPGIVFCTILFTAVLILTTSIVVPLEASSTLYTETRLFPIDCPLEIAPRYVAGGDVTCYTLSVPLQHGNPEGIQISVFIIQIHSTSGQPAPDPLVMEPGGPGGSILGLVQPALNMVRNRDIVLVEPRGVGLSYPAIDCPELRNWASKVLMAGLPDTHMDYRVPLAACYARWQERDINLSAFNSIEMAADIVIAVRALGYDQFNYLGGSYATALGQHIARDYPDILRSMVLAGPVPLEGSHNTLGPLSVQNAFRQLFDSCAEDPACAARYPDLEQVFFDLVDAYNAAPPTMQYTASASSAFAIDGDTLIRILYRHLYATTDIPALPTMIDALQHGDTRFIMDFPRAWLLPIPAMSGLYYSVMCAEEYDYTTAHFVAQDVDPRIDRALHSYFDLRSACDVWQVEHLPTVVNEAVESDVPTLILAGAFDPVTPLDNAGSVVQGLENVHVIDLPSTGHYIGLRAGCIRDIMDTFMAQPDDLPDVSCLQNLERVFVVDSINE